VNKGRDDRRGDDQCKSIPFPPGSADRRITTVEDSRPQSFSREFSDLENFVGRERDDSHTFSLNVTSNIG